ncbi:B12-binding domain-containing radical SAM protein [Dendrosporobacter sp. 1207_IL3150]|uniref:B12-binding domain-containing radical SAM protein n=1 Tax=Dendrosporobacter sp. 1207_IL3150 TaxID=3084054 RepID=UPI002FDAE287
MKKPIELLLVNSFAPRQRIVSDAALENSLAIIRTYLENKGFNVHVNDEQRISGAEQGVPSWCLMFLRFFIMLQIKAYSKMKPLAALFIILTWPLQSLALFYRKKHMDNLITAIVNQIQHEKIPMVGIKLWNGDAYTWSIQLAEKIKELSPETTIVAGGPQVKVYGEKVLEADIFDLVIMGPGEEILESLLKMRRSSKNHTDFMELVYNRLGENRLIRTGNYNGQSNYMISKFTIPEYNNADLQDKILFHTLIDGVGCSWNQCNFCSHTRQNMQYIPRPVEDIKEEILKMNAKGISFFRFSSSETPIFHGKAIARMLLDDNIAVNYSMFIRASNVTRETYEAYCLMIRSGLRAVFLGGETGHDLINTKVMNKGVAKKNIVDTIQCIKLASEHVGLPCNIGLSLIYPTPIIESVTLEDVFRENIDLIEQTSPDTVIINPPGVLPGTKWFDQASSFGFQMADTFVKDLMHYEYSMYKPIHAWTKLGYSLNGQDMYSILNETGKLHKAVEAMHIPLGISDEYLMMLTAIGQGSKIDLLKFKQRSLIDIMTGSSNYIKEIVAKINAHSQKVAKSNIR